jgi:hypothetical protein
VGEFIRKLHLAGYSGDYEALSLHPYAFKGDVNGFRGQGAPPSRSRGSCPMAAWIPPSATAAGSSPESPNRSK